MNSLEERVSRLERENRRLKGAVLAMVALLGGACLTASTAPPSTPGVVRAREFQLVDAAGKPLGRWNAEDNVSKLVVSQLEVGETLGVRFLRIRDATGKVQGQWDADASRSTLFMGSSREGAWIELSVDQSDESLDDLKLPARAVVSTAVGRQNAALFTFRDDASGLDILGPAGKKGATFSLDAKGRLTSGLSR